MLTVTNEDVLPAYLQRVSDFEDCLLATCTKANQCDAIVTMNKKVFFPFGYIAFSGRTAEYLFVKICFYNRQQKES